MASGVHEHVGVIILAVFIVIAVFGPVGCIIFTRRREHRKYHPSPKAFRKARTKLGTVADCRRDTEKGLSGDPEWTDNCPICIGPLCPSIHDEAGHEAGREAMVEIKEALSGPRDAGDAGGSRAAEGCDTEARNSTASKAVEGADPEARNSTASSAAEQGGTEARSSTASNGSNAPVDRTVPDLNDPETQASRVERVRLSMRRHRVSTERHVEILKLRSCGHWFHARCLSSWFLIDRYDCPVCRKSYWDGKAKRLGPMQTFLRSEYSSTPSAGRMGLAAVV